VRLDGDEVVPDADDGDAGHATRTYMVSGLAPRGTVVQWNFRRATSTSGGTSRRSTTSRTRRISLDYLGAPWDAWAVVIGTGGLGEVGPEAWDYEGRRWVSLFEGDYAKAKIIMSALDSAEIEHRLKVPEPNKVVVEVRRNTLAESRALVAGTA
jgi:hypothetical protein